VKQPKAPVVFEPPKARPTSDWHRIIIQDEFAARELWRAVRSVESRVPGTWENTLCEEALCAIEAGEMIALRRHLAHFPDRDEIRHALR
jgi:hypothetical protein